MRFTQSDCTFSGVLVTAGDGENPGNGNRNRDFQFRAAGCVGCGLRRLSRGKIREYRGAAKARSARPMSRRGAAAATERLGGRGFPKSPRALFPRPGEGMRGTPGGAATVQDDGGWAKTFEKRRRERLRRRNWHCAEAGHRLGVQATGVERSEPPGKGRAASVSERRREGLQRKSERSGDWSGKPGREATRTKAKAESETAKQSSAASPEPAEGRRPDEEKGTAGSLASAREQRRSRGTVRRLRRL